MGKISIYNLDVDGVPLQPEVFKSSGIIISTGTGSSGWLLSARRMALSDVRAILNHIGQHSEGSLIEEHLASKIAQESVFAYDEQQMYYYIRENFSTDKQKSGRSNLEEGFCTNLKFKSHLIDGLVYLDGYDTLEIGVGDEFEVSMGKELKCLRFLI